MKTKLEQGLAKRASENRRHARRIKWDKKDLSKYDKRGLYVGYSLSSCVHDILRGYMPLECVVGMTTSTRLSSIEAMHTWIKQYQDDAVAYGSPVTFKPFPTEEYVEVFEHILFRCRFIQYRIHEPINDSWPKWLHGNGNGGYPFTHKGHMAGLGVSGWLRIDPKKFRKYITDNSPTNDLKTKAKK
tara:strand:+ start:38 stop:595 length:558 start_codon:yes stop_codon:yes gene_type:complete